MGGTDPSAPVYASGLSFVNDDERTREVYRRFRDLGFDVFWVEDPVFRSDVDGMRRVVESTPETQVTVGEYRGFEAKRSLLEAGACDVLNLQGLTAARRAATLAQSTGTPVAISTDHATDATSVHAGLSLPDVVAVECCYRDVRKRFSGRPHGFLRSIL